MCPSTNAVPTHITGSPEAGPVAEARVAEAEAEAHGEAKAPIAMNEKFFPKVGARQDQETLLNRYMINEYPLFDSANGPPCQMHGKLVAWARLFKNFDHRLLWTQALLLPRWSTFTKVVPLGEIGDVDVPRVC